MPVMQQEKQCNRCGGVFPADAFPRNCGMPDGRIKQCKNCRALIDKKWREANRERKAESDRRWREQNAERKAAGWARWQREHPEQVREQAARYAERYPEKAKAVRAVGNAVRDGKLIKPDHCEDCEKPFEKRLIQGHHQDYSKPLEVEWLCPKCHKLRHAKGRR